MMTTNLFVIANVKQLRTDGSFRILLTFFRNSWGVASWIRHFFNSFHNLFAFGRVLEGLRNWGGGFEPPKPPPRYATGGYTRRLAGTAGIKKLSFWHRWVRHVVGSVLPTRPLPIQSYLYVAAMLILSINFLRTLFEFMECVSIGIVI